MKNVKNFKRVLVGLALGASASAASAGELGAFEWSKSELVDAQGIVAVYERAESHAGRYCRAHLRGTKDLGAVSECRSAVTEEIVSKVGDVRLTAYAETGEAALGALAAR